MQWILVWKYSKYQMLDRCVRRARIQVRDQCERVARHNARRNAHSQHKKTACGPSLRQPARRCSDAYACAVALASSSKLTSLSVTLALLRTKSTTLASTTYASISARRCWFE